MKFITLLALIATAVSVQAKDDSSKLLSANIQTNLLSTRRMLKAEHRELVDIEDLEEDDLDIDEEGIDLDEDNEDENLEDDGDLEVEDIDEKNGNDAKEETAEKKYLRLRRLHRKIHSFLRRSRLERGYSQRRRKSRRYGRRGYADVRRRRSRNYRRRHPYVVNKTYMIFIGTDGPQGLGEKRRAGRNRGMSYRRQPRFARHSNNKYMIWIGGDGPRPPRSRRSRRGLWRSRRRGFRRGGRRIRSTRRRGYSRRGATRRSRSGGRRWRRNRRSDRRRGRSATRRRKLSKKSRRARILFG